MPATNKGHKPKANRKPKTRKAKEGGPIYVIVYPGSIVGRPWGSRKAAENFNRRSKDKGTVRKVR